MAQIHLEMCLTQCVKKDEEIVSKLLALTTEVESHHSSCNAYKTGGTAVGAAGTGLMLASLFFAPVTAGASLIMGAGGALLSVGGSATAIATDISDRNKSKEIIANIEEIVKDKEKVTNALKEQIDQFGGLVKHLVSNGIDEENAVQAILKGIANESVHLETAAHDDFMLRTLKTAGRLMQAQDIAIKSLPILVRTLHLGNINWKAINSILGITGAASSGFLKTVGKLAIFASVALTVVDVGLLIRDWASDHPTIEVINDVVKQLNEEIEHYKELLDVIDSFKERVWLSAIGDIPIVGSSNEVSEALAALLNSDVAKCKQILEKIGIDWHFEELASSDDAMAQFFLDHSTAKGLNADELLSILVENNVEANPTNVTLVQELLEKLKHFKQEPGEDTRKEPVISPNVISVYRNIIDLFLKDHLGKGNLTDLTKISPGNSTIYKDYYFPLSEDINSKIQTHIVAQVPSKFSYFNASSAIHGNLLHALCDNSKLQMMNLYLDSVHDVDLETKIRTNVLQVNQLRTYVDEIALQHWLQRGGNMLTFENCRLEVQKMFMNLHDKLFVWLDEIKRAGY